MTIELIYIGKTLISRSNQC